MQAYGGNREKSFVLTIEKVSDQDRGVSVKENNKILLDVMQDPDSSDFSLITLKNRDKRVKDEDVLEGEEITNSQMGSLLDVEGGIDRLIRSGGQNIIEINPELKSELDQNKEIKITCLDLSDSKIGDKLASVLVEELLPQLPHLTHLVLKNCEITKKTAKALVKVLEENQELLKKLQWVDLSQNRLNMSAILELKRVLIRNKDSQINKSSFVNAIEGSLLKKTKEKALVLSEDWSGKEVLEKVEVLVKKFKESKDSKQINKIDEEILKEVKALAKIGEDIIEKKGDNVALLHLNGGFMNLVGPLLELTEKYTFIISSQWCQGVGNLKTLKDGMLLVKNLEKWNRVGCLKELDLRISFKGDQLLSKKVADGIKNVLMKHSVSCFKLTGNYYKDDTAVDLLEELLKENTSLKELHVNESGMNDDGVKKIAEVLLENRSLEVLNLARNEIGDEGSNALAKVIKKNKNSSLKKINLFDNYICNIEKWLGCGLGKSSLVELNLGHNEIGDEKIDLFRLLFKNTVSLDSQKFDREIKEIKRKIEKKIELKKVRITYSQLGDRGVEELVTVLQECTSLTSLELYKNKIKNEGARTLSQVIKNNIALEYLDLSCNQIEDIGVQFLVEALIENSVLKGLYLSDNQIGDKGLRYFYDFLFLKSFRLEPLQTLVSLKLDSNQFGDEGVIFLAEGLENNILLEDLDLSDNQFGDVGIEFLANALSGHPVLEYLNLSNNKIGNEGAIGISNKLGKNNNTFLKNLSLGGNQIEDEGAKALASAFNEYGRSFSLDLCNNKIKDKKSIKAIWEENKNLSERQSSYLHLN